MTVATMERAAALRGIADRFPCTDEEAALLRELADEQQRKAEYDAWVRAEVAAARAETGSGYTTDEVRAYVRERLREKYGYEAQPASEAKLQVQAA